MVELIDARIVARRLPEGVEAKVPPAPVVLRNTGGQWRIEAPLDGSVLPLVEWFMHEPLVRDFPEGTCLSIERHPSGGVCVQLLAPRPSVERFLDWLRPEVAETRLRRLGHAESGAPTLTSMQDDALRRAVALGYYEIPRSIHLSELASKLSVSPAALSERLRRAEARLVTHHVARGGAGDGAER